MDTPQESAASLSVRDAAALFNAPPEPQEQQQPAQAEPAKVETQREPPKATQAETAPETVEVQPEVRDEILTIEVDGKSVELKKSELADYYKNGLRQADYTRKTMEAAEQRKSAEAEATKAREERQRYAQGLSQAQSLLQAQLHEQSQLDWQSLLQTDPVEYLKQQHLAQQRQARLGQIQQEQQQIFAKQQEEQAEQIKSHLRTQQDELLAKLPEWKDEAKAKADKAALTDYLKSQGLEDAQINNIADHRLVILSRKAMLYDQMMTKAKAAAEKVATLPGKVEKPGGGEVNPLDGRTAAMQRLQKSGSVRDAAKVFALLK